MLKESNSLLDGRISGSLYAAAIAFARCVLHYLQVAATPGGLIEVHLANPILGTQTSHGADDDTCSLTFLWVPSQNGRRLECPHMQQ